MQQYHVLLIAMLLASFCPSVIPFAPFLNPKYISRQLKNKDVGLQMAFKQEFGTGGKILLAVSIACLLKSRLTTIDVRSTTICPSGPGHEKVIETFQTNDKDYHCLPLGDWVKQIITSPIVLPGSADWDPTVFQGPRGLPNSVPLKR